MDEDAGKEKEDDDNKDDKKDNNSNNTRAAPKRKKCLLEVLVVPSNQANCVLLYCSACLSVAAFRRKGPKIHSFLGDVEKMFQKKEKEILLYYTIYIYIYMDSATVRMFFVLFFFTSIRWPTSVEARGITI